MSGSHYSGNLEKGGRVQFLDMSNNGMESDVHSLTENREVTFRHVHEIEAGKVGQSLGNMKETYLLEESNGVTTLSLTSDMPEQYFSDMDAATTKALQIVKELAEA